MEAEERKTELNIPLPFSRRVGEKKEQIGYAEQLLISAEISLLIQELGRCLAEICSFHRLLAPPLVP